MDIREFEAGDKEQILALFEKFGHFFLAIDDLHRLRVGEQYAQNFFEEMIANTSEGKGIVFVAAENQKLVGFIAGNVTEITLENSQESIPAIKGRILEFFIAEEFRGQGLGSQMIKKLEEYFRSRNCDIVNVEVFAPNKSAYEFYKNQGFVDRNYDLIKVLK